MSSFACGALIGHRSAMRLPHTSRWHASPAIATGRLCSPLHRHATPAEYPRSAYISKGPRGQHLVRAEDVEVQDRVLGALPYVIPLLDGVRYGRYFFLQFPASTQILAPIRPLVNIYYSVPFLSLVIFFALYSGVVNNFSFSRFVRFNAMQAILLSVLLVIPSLLEQLLRPSGGAGFQLQINLYNTVWLFVATCVVYAVSSSLLGRVARLPLIAGAADQRVL